MFYSCHAVGHIVTVCHVGITSSHTHNYFQLVNMCSNDGQRLYEAFIFGSLSFAGVPAIGGAIYTISLVGLWGMLGFGIFFLFIGIQVGTKAKLCRLGFS